MAHSFDTNSIPATGAISIYKLFACMLLQVWTKIDSSDGVTAHPGGQVVSGATGATGLGNTNAWYVIRDPGGVRSFCFQRGTTNAVWRIKYSKSAGFIGGTPGTIRVPSAADEQILHGGGTDAIPTFTTILSTDGSYHFNCCAGDATVGYGWWWHSFPTGSPSGTQGGMMLDVMLAGSYPVSDTDPAVIYLPIPTTGIFGTDLVDTLNVKGYMGTTFLVMSALSYRAAGAQCFPAYTATTGVAPNPFTSKDDALPIPYGRSMQQTASPYVYGYKGIGKLLLWAGSWRNPYDTVNTTGPASRDKVWINGALLPWDGSIPVTV